MQRKSEREREEGWGGGKREGTRKRGERETAEREREQHAVTQWPSPPPHPFLRTYLSAAPFWRASFKYINVDNIICLLDTIVIGNWVPKVYNLSILEGREGTKLRLSFRDRLD